MSDDNRRNFLKKISAALMLSLVNVKRAPAATPVFNPDVFPVNIIIPRHYRPPYGDPAYPRQLTRAVLAVLEKHFSSTPMPVWNRRFGEVDMEKRIRNITYWLMLGVQQHERIYPVDPAFIMAMIMKESYFYEYAVSASLAVGICQFVQPTAQSYDMLCAGTRPEHAAPPYRLPHLATRIAEYYQLRHQRKQYRRNNRPPKRFQLKEALEIIRSGDTREHRQSAEAYLTYLNRLEEFNRQQQQTRDDFREYLRANVEERDIFNERDLQFILGFDERFTYKKPVIAMVKMIAEALRARNGNIIAAAIGYNAGLSTTRAAGRYEPYGMIPAIEQSTTYLSHVLVNHHEICQGL